MTTEAIITSKETEILSHLEVPMAAEAARAILQIEFREQDRQRMQQLLEKGNQGTRTTEEDQEANAYERVGHLIGILKSIARRTLKQSPPT